MTKFNTYLQRSKKVFLQIVRPSVLIKKPQFMAAGATVAFCLVFAGAFVSERASVVSLAPEQIGLGQGVAACFGSLGPSCDGSGRNNLSFSWNETAASGHSPSCESNGDSSLRINLHDGGGNFVQSLGSSVPCSGSSSFSSLLTGGAGYQIWVLGNNSGYTYERYSFTAVSCAPPANQPAAQVSGNLSVYPSSPCVAAPGATTCQATVSWSTQNAQYSVVQAAGTSWWQGGANIHGPVADSNGNLVYNLPIGEYIFSVSGYDGASWGTPLSQRTYYVVPAPVAITWTPYCTGGSDPNGNNWQWWQYSNTSPVQYQYLRAGDGACAPPAAGNPSVYAACDGSGTGVTLSWSPVSGATYYPRVSANLSSCPAGWTHWEYGCYKDNIAETYAYLSGITPGVTYSTWVHTNVGGTVNWTANMSSFSCTALTAPTMTASCNAGGTSAVLSWSTPAGATKFYPRYYRPTTESCASGWTSWSADPRVCYIDNYSGTSITVPTTPNALYSAWVHPGDPVNWNVSGNTPVFSCGGTPDLTVSGITPTSAVAGTPTTFSATVTNTGGGSTNIGFQNFYQVRSNTTATAPHNIFTKLFNIAHAAEVITDLAASNMSALTAWGSGIATQSYTFPAAGTYGIRVCADKSYSGDTVGVIAESNEANNCGGWTDVNVTAACTVGAACSVSNACNYATGTYDSGCNCSATVPPVPATYGNSCTSGANVCGQTSSGTVMCNGSCSVAAPSDTQCLPTISLSADPTRVRKDTSTKLDWSTTDAISCSVTGQNGFSSTALSGADVDSGPLDAQTTFTLTCTNAYGSNSASAVVNLLPSYIEQ